MAYVTAVTDRVLSDVTTPTAKGYMNVADWTRIYGNARVTNSLVEIELGTPIVFNQIAAVTTSTIGSVTNFNILLANIERLRDAVAGESIPGTTTEIVANWVAGVTQDAPDYTDANLWESTVDAIWVYYDGPDLTVDSVLMANLTILTGTSLVIVDSLTTGDYDIDIQGTGKLYII